MRNFLLIVFIACSPSTPKPVAPATHIDRGYIDLRGVHTYYEIHGDGPPLLLLHGGTGGIESFGPQIERFAKDHRVFAPERMGQGRTPDVMSIPFHHHEMAEHMIAFLDAMHVRQADVVGWSDGGYVGLDMVVNHPDRIRRLVITGASYRTDADPAFNEMFRTMKASDWAPWIIDEYKRLSPDGIAHWPIFFDRFRTMWLTDPSITVDQLKLIKVPVLLMSGDPDVPLADLQTMRESIPHAQLAIYPNATHLWPRDKPDVFHSIVHEFLTTPDVTDATPSAR